MAKINNSEVRKALLQTGNVRPSVFSNAPIRKDNNETSKQHAILARRNSFNVVKTAKVE